MVVPVDWFGLPSLAIVHQLQGASLAAVALGVAIAAGFVFLGWMQFLFGR
jgi:hypothetical protein